jgi:hypothetical protein
MAVVLGRAKDYSLRMRRHRNSTRVTTFGSAIVRRHEREHFAAFSAPRVEQASIAERIFALAASRAGPNGERIAPERARALFDVLGRVAALIVRLERADRLAHRRLV